MSIFGIRMHGILAGASDGNMHGGLSSTFAVKRSDARLFPCSRRPTRLVDR